MTEVVYNLAGDEAGATRVTVTVGCGGSDESVLESRQIVAVVDDGECLQSLARLECDSDGLVDLYRALGQCAGKALAETVRDAGDRMDLALRIHRAFAGEMLVELALCSLERPGGDELAEK